MPRKELVRQINLSCKRAAQLLSESQDRSLSLAERTALQAHLLICRGCRALSNQLAFIRRGVKKLFDQQP